MAKYKAYPEYKDSGVEWLGNVPIHWRTISISRLFSRNKRTGYTGKELLSVYRDYGVIPKSSRDDNNNKPSEDLSPYQLVEPNDLVMNKMKAWQGSIAISEYEGIVSPAYFVYQPNKVLFELAHLRYVHYLLRNPIYVTQYLSRSKGIRVSQWDLDPDEFRNIELLLPDKSEQESIYSFLDHETAKIDNLIEKQQQLIELLKEKRQTVISYAVTKGLNPDVPMKDSGVEWLGEVPEHWDVCRIKQLSKQISKGTTPSTIGGDFVDDGIRFLKAENIGKSKEVNLYPQFYITSAVDKQISRSRLQDKDILVIIAGATTGMASVLQKELLPANTNQAVSFIRPKNINHADWIYYWLGAEFTQRIIGMGAVQAAQPNLSMEDLGGIPVLLPPKNEIYSICLEIEKLSIKFELLISKAESAIELMQERRTALISAAVTGKIDVRDWVAPDTRDIEESLEVNA
ncbi:restriction endonuclease subunit S [Pectobacterium sp. S5]|uniref:restriction endonuclease subunit S n=1 Tax=Pectobacterium TaxID=122277 RepID=UPI003D9B978D